MSRVLPDSDCPLLLRRLQHQLFDLTPDHALLVNQLSLHEVGQFYVALILDLLHNPLNPLDPQQLSKLVLVLFHQFHEVAPAYRLFG